ncbi:MAG: hypothetical protein IJK89_09585, partial [Clostridia bacterium]|nr:hypothetical protein [Clostridia bacterium]
FILSSNITFPLIYAVIISSPVSILIFLRNLSRFFQESMEKPEKECYNMAHKAEGEKAYV